MPKLMEKPLTAMLDEYAGQGFSLYMIDDHCCGLDFKTEPICQFNTARILCQPIVQIKAEVKKACQMYLNTGRAW